METKRLTKLELEILRNLESENEQQVLNAIANLREISGDFAILTLMSKYFSSASEEVVNQIGNLITDIKSSIAGNLIAEHIMKYENHSRLDKFLELLWTSSLHFSDLQPFTKLLYSSNMRVVIESSTVIDENLLRISDENRDLCLKIINKNKAETEFQTEIIKSIEENFKN
jgi:predicted nucleotidyltransferase